MNIINQTTVLGILDWNIEPLVKIEIVDYLQSCPEGSYDIFNRTWHGTAIGCNTMTEGIK